MANTMVGDDMLEDELMWPSTPTLAANREIWTKFGDQSLIYGHGTTPDEGRDWDELQMPSFFNDALDVSLSAPMPSTPSVQDNRDVIPVQVSPASFREEAVVPSNDRYSRPASPRGDFAAPISSNIVVELPQSTLNNPRSVYDGFDPGLPIMTEREAVRTLLDALGQPATEQDGFIEFNLLDFTVYVDSAIYPNEMRPLQHLATRVASDKFYLDGKLQVGDQLVFVKRVPFRELPIGNYCDIKEHSVDDQIWVRSELNKNREIYYKLVAPSTEYERFWTPFRWIADLSKHVVDYSLHFQKKKKRARLQHFQDEFSTYIIRQHHRSVAFQRWLTAHGSTDFRNALVANIDFIWKEAMGLPAPDNKIATCHDFWSEVKGTYYVSMPTTSAPPTTLDEDSSTITEGTSHKSRGKASKPIGKTVVTPYIFNLFSHMGFENIIESVAPSDTVQVDQLRQIQVTKSAQAVLYTGVNQTTSHEGFLAGIQAGDVISTPPDGDDTGTKWKREISKHHKSDYVWYGMVQKVHETPRGRRFFDVIWMYQARDTPCALMKYPWPNELFLSDTCTCGLERVDERDVLGTHKVAWFGKPTETLPTDFFVRQTYLAEERCWVSLAEDHLGCNHHKKVRHRSVQRRYQQGHTILLKLPKSNRLDVFVIERLYKEEDKRWARLRKLPRRNEVDKPGNYPANELIYTEQFVVVESKRIIRHCLVEVFDWQDEITSPYSRGGTGDAFYLTHQEITVLEEPIVPIGDPMSLHFRRGFRPTSITATPKLRGLDLYCGGGNFGRGIEDGGGVEMRWANDISTNAIHSYMANAPESCTPFLGSVDDLFRSILNGHPDAPRPGEVQFISGGSPCQGFSRLTTVTLQKTLRQWKNRSLVASFASFIDLFRPQYGLLENVVSMVKAQEKRQECFFSQLVCAIVGLGYQVRIVYADAWSYGAPQSRCRVFLSFAAPGVQLPKAPEPTHSHPPGISMGSLGKMSNGQPFGKRAHVATQFKFTSALQAARDLPDIRDGMADYCIGYPSHRISIGFTPRMREQLRSILNQPYGLGFSKARFGYKHNGKRISGTITDAVRDNIFPSNKEFRTQPGTLGWMRVHPHSLFRTVVTRCGPTDRLTGCVNHWHQSRPLSVLEVRRAQGFLDHEVITGKPHQQWHIVGNSVSRHVALALGLAIREAWFGTLYEESPPTDMGVHMDNELTEILVDDPAPPPPQLTEEDHAIEQASDILSDPFVDPISTPPTSINNSLEEEAGLSKRYMQKRRKSQLDIVSMSAKRIRWSSSTTDELSGNIDA